MGKEEEELPPVKSGSVIKFLSHFFLRVGSLCTSSFLLTVPLPTDTTITSWFLKSSAVLYVHRQKCFMTGHLIQMQFAYSLAL